MSVLTPSEHAADGVPHAPGTKTAVITGAASGIGRATAFAFTRAGWCTVLVDRDEDELKQVGSELPEAELESAGAGPDEVQLLCATGTHRQATAAEMAELVGDDIVERYPIHDHVATDDDHVEVGPVDATPVLLDRRYVEADVRIITGFVEPHFFAGFSGGPKAVCPGVAGLETILAAHSPARIADPRSTWLSIADNPVHRFVREAVALCPPDFSVDVCIDRERRLTGVFAGAYREAHEAARAFTEQTAVRHVPRRFDVVVTTNSGYPLDRNLYQSTKGMAAAERVVVPGGTIVMAAECCDGLPPEGGFGDMLHRASTIDDLLATAVPAELDRWQVQVFARVVARHRVQLRTDGLADAEVRAAHLEPIADVTEAVADALARAGRAATACVLPQGPLTVATAPG